MRRLAAVLVVYGVCVGSLDGQAPVERIRTLRDQSNAAIALHDVAGVVSSLDAEYQITIGSGALYNDRAAEPDAWAAEFARAEDLVYVRTPESIELDSSGARAAEVGVWSGSWTTPQGSETSGGRYAAHWVLIEGDWKLRAELFVTLRCNGAGCLPANPSPAAYQGSADRIRQLRAESNAAIARHDLEGVVSQYDREYQATGGLGGTLRGEAMRDAWTARFRQADDLVYVRTPGLVEVSSSGSRAAEVGTWSGSMTTAQGVRRSGGRYAAHWVLIGDDWKLRSELFVSLW